MGILGQLGALGGEAGENSGARGPAQGGITTALMQVLQQHPGGIGALLQSFRQNGLSGQVDQWASGQQTTASPQQVQQGLQGTGVVENTAQKAGVPHEVAAAAIAALLPALIRHFAPGGQPAAQGELGSLAQQFLSRML